jgi:hypothetical protein
MWMCSIKRRLPHCQKLGSKIAWYSIQAPLQGTDVANVMKKLCPTLLADPKFGTGVDCALKNDTKTGKPVVPSQYTLAASWESLRASQVPKWVTTIAESTIAGSMCGAIATDYSKPANIADKTAFGAIAREMALSRITNAALKDDWNARNRDSMRVPRSGNDGIVPLSSCRVAKPYQKLPSSKYYIIDGDHDYGTCSLGTSCIACFCAPATHSVRISVHDTIRHDTNRSKTA